jgi:hypothetical protein
MRAPRSLETVHTMEGSNGQRLFLREFGLARALQLLFIVGHARGARSLIRWGVTYAPEDIREALERIGDVGKAGPLRGEHIEEVFTRGVEEGKGTTAAEVDVVGERGEELLARGRDERCAGEDVIEGLGEGGRERGSKWEI